MPGALTPRGFPRCERSLLLRHPLAAQRYFPTVHRTNVNRFRRSDQHDF
jgi:hypothetical protein